MPDLATAPRADGLPKRGKAATAADRPPLELARRIVELAEDKKAADIILLDLGALTTMADYFVICSGGSERQLEAIADGIIGGLRDERLRPIGREGTAASHWVCSTTAPSSSTSSRRPSATTTGWRSTGPRRRRSSRCSDRGPRPRRLTYRSGSTDGSCRAHRWRSYIRAMAAVRDRCPACARRLITTRFDTTFRLPDRSERLCFGIPGGLCEDCSQLYIDPDLIELLDLGEGRCVFAIESDLVVQEQAWSSAD
jgi:ribosome silencing factor RsfS/YbeB/iojap